MNVNQVYLIINKISTWKSAGTYSHINDSNMIAVKNASGDLPEAKVDDDLYIYLSGNHFQQNNRIITTINKVISIPSVNTYFVYKLDPIASIRDTTFTIQNALFGAMQITKNADASKYDYKGYGICFNERSQFGHIITEGGRVHTTNGRNVLIFGAEMVLAFIKLIEKTIYMLWVMDLHKVFTILRYM